MKHIDLIHQLVERLVYESHFRFLEDAGSSFAYVCGSHFLGPLNADSMVQGSQLIEQN